MRPIPALTRACGRRRRLSRAQAAGLRGVLAATACSVLMALDAAGQSMEELEVLLAAHPSLVALVHAAEADQERGTAAMALPDPVVSLGVQNFPIFDPSFSRFLPTSKAIGVRQEFPNRAARTARADMSRAAAQRTQRIRRAQLATLRGELIALLHEKEQIGRRREYAMAQSGRYDELTAVVEAEIDAGRPAVFRLAQIEAKRAGVARLLVQLDREEAEADARLAELVGTVPRTAAPAVIPVDWSGDVMEFHAVQVAQAGIETADHAVDEAKAGWRPNLGAQLTYQQRQAGEDFAGDDWISGMVTFTVPLWADRSQAPRLRAARAEKSSAQAHYQAAARRAVARHQAEQATWRAARDSIAVLNRNITAVREEIQSQLTVYERGSGDYSPILDGEITILRLKAEIAVETARRAGAIARMNALLVVR